MKRLLSFLLILTSLVSLLVPLCFSASAISLSAKSAILLDAAEGQVLYQKNAFVKLPMASTTKIMTAIVAIESMPLSTEIEISPDATGIEGSSIYLYPNEKLTMESLIYALLLESANDAATAIAIAVSGNVKDFAQKMNQKATELGLTGTHFENPHGLDDEEHYTTAYDLARLAAYALSNDTFLNICSAYKKTIPLNGDDGVRVLVNHNKLLHMYEGTIGVKTGFTKKSGRCLVSAAKRNGLTLIAVTLNAPDDWNDHKVMLDFGFANYEHLVAKDVGEYEISLPVVGGTSASLKVKNSTALAKTLNQDHGEITYLTEVPRFLYAPIKKGDTVGTVVCMCDGHVIASSDLIATEDISGSKPKNLWAWLTSLFRRK